MTRPSTLAEVARRSDSLESFGRNLQDWLHELGRMSSRRQVQQAVAKVPRTLAADFPQGDVADAYLAAYADLASVRAGVVPPEWAFAPARVLARPWFAEPTNNRENLRWAFILTPLAFKRRNLFAARVDLPLRLRRGRPAIPAAQKRLANAERQRRFRARRKAELQRLRRIAGE